MDPLAKTGLLILGAGALFLGTAVFAGSLNSEVKPLLIGVGIVVGVMLLVAAFSKNE